MTKYEKEIERLFEQYSNDKISIDDFNQRRRALDKKYEIFIQEKAVKSYTFSVGFGIIAIVVCGFISISSFFEGKNILFILNGILIVVNSVNLYFNLKRLKKAKIKLIKDCLT